MITEKLNNLINEANAYSNYSSSWSPITSSSKDAEKYNKISTGDWINTYINTTTTSPDGITWTAPYVSTTSTTSSITADIDDLATQIDILNHKITTLEVDNNMLKWERDQLKAQNDAFETRLKQLEALVRTVIANIEE